MSQTFARAARQVARYFRTSGWIAREGLRDAKVQVSVATACNVLGVATAGLSLGAILLYARRAEQGLPFLGLEFTAVSSRLLIGAAALLIGLLSAVSLYYAEVITHRLARQYHTNCIRRVLRAACRPDIDEILAEASKGSGRPISLPYLVGPTAKYCGFALRSLIRLLLPLMYTTVAVGYLFWINAPLTLALSGLAAIYFVPLMVINRNVSRQFRQYRETVPQVASSLKMGVQAFQATSGPVRDERVWGPGLLENPDFESMQRLLYTHRLAGKKVGFLNGAVFILCLFVLFVVAAPSDGGSWTALIAYIVALRFAWTGIRQLTTLMIIVSRFFSEYEAFALFLGLAGQETRAQDGPSAPRPLATTLEIAVSSSEGTARDDSVPIKPGSVIITLAAGTREGDGLRRVISTVLSAADDPSARAVRTITHGIPKPLPGIRISDQALGVNGSPQRLAHFEDLLSRFGVLDEIRRLPDAARTGLTKDQAQALSRKAAFAIGAAYLFETESSIVALPLRALRNLDDAAQRVFLEGVRDHAILLTDQSADTVFEPGAAGVRDQVDGVLVLDDAGPMYGGSLPWLDANRSWIESLLEKQRPPDERAELDESENLLLVEDMEA